MKKLAQAVLLAALSVSAASAAQAADTGKRGGFLAQMDLDFGGDDVATLSFTDGDTQDVKAGQGLGVAVGGWLRPVASVPFELQGIDRLQGGVHRRGKRRHQDDALDAAAQRRLSLRQRLVRRRRLRAAHEPRARRRWLLRRLRIRRRQRFQRRGRLEVDRAALHQDRIFEPRIRRRRREQRRHSPHVSLRRLESAD